MAKKKKKGNARVILRKSDSDVEYSSDFNSKVIAEKKRRSRELGLENDIAMQIAGSRVFRRFWYFPDDKVLFPLNPKHRYVERVFPYAKDGALCVDEPEDDESIEACKLKARHLAERGFRYIYLTSGTTFEDAMIQLEEQKQWQTGQRRQAI